MTDVLTEAAALAAAGRPFVLATVVWRRAPSSGRPGAKALVLPDGSVHGWIGGACAQPTLVRQALEVLDTGEPRLVFLGPADDFDGALREGVVRVPMACESEGALEIYLEPVAPAPRVVVVGDSPLTSTLAGLVGQLGWTVAVVDSTDDIEVSDAGTAVVVATQGRYDEQAVQAALASPAGYVGLVASRKRAAAVVEFVADGVPAGALARLHAPAGLDLGSVSHDEIAVAVLAELVALRASGGLRPVPAQRVAAPLSAVDPVCGMTVTVEGARHVSVWNGMAVYFCAASCRRSFEADPAKYATPAAP